MKVVKIFAVIFMTAVILCASGCEKSENIQVFDADREETEESGIRMEDGTGTEGESSTAEEAEEPIQKQRAAAESSIFVYVCGAVREPGVVELTEGSRVYEAIQKAGGMTEEAADFAVNQAALLEDGQQITVPTTEEAKGWTPEEGVQSAVPGQADSERKVNINQAAAEELMTLPGIGESKAEGIIEYRESAGGFQSVEEIKNVSGIGDAVFERIKDRIVI